MSVKKIVRAIADLYGDQPLWRSASMALSLYGAQRDAQLCAVKHCEQVIESKSSRLTQLLISRNIGLDARTSDVLDDGQFLGQVQIID